MSDRNHLILSVPYREWGPCIVCESFSPVSDPFSPVSGPQKGTPRTTEPVSRPYLHRLECTLFESFPPQLSCHFLPETLPPDYTSEPIQERKGLRYKPRTYGTRGLAPVAHPGCRYPLVLTGPILQCRSPTDQGEVVGRTGVHSRHLLGHPSRNGGRNPLGYERCPIYSRETLRDSIVRTDRDEIWTERGPFLECETRSRGPDGSVETQSKSPSIEIRRTRSD